MTVKAYARGQVNMIKDVRHEFGNPKMAVSIPVSGFDGWMQTSPRRLGIIKAQFDAANATRHPEVSAATVGHGLLLCAKQDRLLRTAGRACHRRGDEGLLAMRAGRRELPEHTTLPLRP